MATYIEARTQIRDGDHIAICGTDFNAKVIALGQRWARLKHPTAKHCGIAYWSDGRLMLAQINGLGNNSVYLSTYADHTFIVSHCPVDFDRNNLDTLLENHLPYYFWGLVLAGVRLFFSRWFQFCRVGSSSFSKLVCSTFAAKFYQDGGWRTLVPKYVAPAEMVAALDLKFIVNP
jgi:hypothetical protein